jgi:predicted exporter
LRADFATAGLGDEWSAPTLALCSAIESAAAGDATAFRAAQPLLATLASERDGLITAVVRLPGAAAQPVPAGGFAKGSAEIFPVSWLSLAAELTALARSDMSRLGLWMLAALAALCALAQRSVRLFALNFAALLLALLGLLVLLAATGTNLSPLSLLSVPLLLGLVIDYSLHILIALGHSRGDLGTTYEHVAAPVLLTGLSSCIGFGAPMLTQQPALRNFGLVMDLGIIAAVVTCLVLLPLLHRATARKSGPQSPLETAP